MWGKEGLMAYRLKIEVNDWIKAQRVLNSIANKDGNLRIAFQTNKVYQMVYLVDFKGNIRMLLYRDKVFNRSYLYVY